MKHSTIIQVLEKVLQKAQQGQPLGSFNKIVPCVDGTSFEYSIVSLPVTIKEA